MKDYLRVEGKVAIITGSGRGIGRGIAKELAAYGVKVMVSDINDENGEGVRDEIRRDGGMAEYCHCDVMKVGDIQNLVRQTVQIFGTVDILVNNAGGGEPPCDFDSITDERWDHYIRFNLYSAFLMIREVFPYMKAQKRGKIINISSGYAIGGGDFCAHYASAKAGVIGLTTSIAKEAAPFGINVNVIPVPTTDTPGLREADFELVADEIPLIPMGRIAVPEDIANTVLFLVSEAANYVTGQIVAPNGGKRMLV